jgi:hypothetical protein
MLRALAAGVAFLAFVGALAAFLVGDADRLAGGLTLLGLVGLSFVVLMSVEPSGPTV